MALEGAPFGQGRAPAVYLAALGRNILRIDYNRDKRLREAV